jgi:hypothetical protein
MMATFSIISLFLALRLFILVSSAPTPAPADTAATSSYWLSSIARQGTVAFGNSGFQVFRNVKDYGAVGDGVYPNTIFVVITNPKQDLMMTLPPSMPLLLMEVAAVKAVTLLRSHQH